ncbi:MAG TPA: hypothetical protein VL326_34025 [Kofleriaceae bacterium]|nr:hypothetical protein [Kofleriaceae bacterium]
MRRIALAFVLFAAGCGRFHFDELAGADDAADAPNDGPHELAPTTELYIKASNTGANDLFGTSVALSADGSTLAVGAPGEASAARGINVDQSDDTAPGAGAVYIFGRSGDTWVQQAYLKASNADIQDTFGAAIELSDDGNTLAVGAWGEASNAQVIGGNEADNSSLGAGAVYVFRRSGSTWSQEAYVKASNAEASDYFAQHLALSGDGATLAVAAVGESSGATGIDGDETDNSVPAAGAVYVFARAGGWTQQAYVKASNTALATTLGDFFGYALALSVDGNTLAVGAPNETGTSSGVGGSQTRLLSNQKGAVYVFSRAGSTWTQQEYIKASNPDFNDGFGGGIALDAAGDALAVSAPNESGNGSSELDNSLSAAGAVYMFSRSGTTWIQEAYLKAPAPRSFELFGTGLALAADGTQLIVAWANDGGSARGIDADPSLAGATNSGGVASYARVGGDWHLRHYCKAFNADMEDRFGTSIALAPDASTLVVGAQNESSAAVGIGGDASDNSATNSGAVYVLQ